MKQLSIVLSEKLKISNNIKVERTLKEWTDENGFDYTPIINKGGCFIEFPLTAFSKYENFMKHAKTPDIWNKFTNYIKDNSNINLSNIKYIYKSPNLSQIEFTYNNEIVLTMKMYSTSGHFVISYDNELNKEYNLENIAILVFEYIDKYEYINN